MIQENAELERSSLAWCKWSLRIGSVVGVTACWEVVGRSLNSLLVPTFTDTTVALWQMCFHRELWQALWISNEAMLIGFALSVMAGVPLGMLTGCCRRLERCCDLYLNILLVTPMSALIPAIIMCLGFGLAPRVAVVFLFAFAVVTVNCQAGLRIVNPKLVEMSRSFGASDIQVWRKIFIPSALPAIMAGLRLGLGRALAGMVVVELLLMAVGVGGLILRYRGDFEAARVYAVILVVLMEAIILAGLLKRLESRLVLQRPG